MTVDVILRRHVDLHRSLVLPEEEPLDVFHLASVRGPVRQADADVVPASPVAGDYSEQDASWVMRNVKGATIFAKRDGVLPKGIKFSHRVTSRAVRSVTLSIRARRISGSRLIAARTSFSMSAAHVRGEIATKRVIVWPSGIVSRASTVIGDPASASMLGADMVRVLRRR